MVKPTARRFIGALRGQIDPDHDKRKKAKDLLHLSKQAFFDFGEMNSEAYQTYLRGQQEEALKLFVAAAKVQEEANRLSQEAEEIYRCLGDYNTDDQL